MIGWNINTIDEGTLKYFWVVTALILVQILMGIITAHYGVEGQAFYGLPLVRYPALFHFPNLAYPACNFLDRDFMAGNRLYLAPAVSGKEPKFQALGVNFLFLALLVIVVGSLDRPMVWRYAETWD